MKFFIILLLLLSNSFAQTATPRETFQTFLKSMVEVKNENNVHDNTMIAASTLDLSWVDPAVLKDMKYKYTQDLITVFDKIEKVDYEKIPNELKPDSWTYKTLSIVENEVVKNLEITVKKINNKWLFTKETLKSLPGFLRAYQERSYVNDIAILKSFRTTLRSYIPNWAHTHFLGIETWQALMFLILIFFIFIIEKTFMYCLEFILNKNFFNLKSLNSKYLHNALNPLGKLFTIGVLLSCLPLLDLNVISLSFFKRALYIAASIVFVWLGHRTIEFFSVYLKSRASLTESKFDDIIIPLLTKTAFVLMYLIGAILIAYSFTIDVTSMLAGLGIGGLAFAFAAKDTLANFFGSIMIVLDRPFDIGDFIVVSGHEGIVEEVGFRSTRIRTFNDSVISISNGELANSAIDNKGKRRFRRMTTSLGLEYSTPPEKIEAFCEGVRQIILAHPFTRKDNFHVYFTGYGASSLDISLVTFWETMDYAREQAEKHRLMIDILRLAAELEVDFAFPTQTVHLFNEEKSQKEALSEKYLDQGIEKAKALGKKPMSLKNPRSNSTDQSQFGENDIGY